MRLDTVLGFRTLNRAHTDRGVAFLSKLLYLLRIHNLQ